MAVDLGHRPIGATESRDLANELEGTIGFTVVDSAGRLVGKVECPMHGRSPDVPDAVSVKAGRLGRRRRLVPVEAIEMIDRSRCTIGLRIDRRRIVTFL